VITIEDRIKSSEKEEEGRKEEREGGR